MMNAQELFGVVVRTFGLGIIFYGLYPLLNLLVEFVQHEHFFFWNILVCVVYVLGGMAVLTRAEQIVRFAYTPRTPR